MKVLLVGGTGVFGSRLARLLVRDGHTVTLAGRTLHTAQSLATELDCHAIQLDRNGPLDMLTDYDVVVDAAGPYHAYEGDPYRLPRAAITTGVHYLDLADNAAFCAGISALDAQARAAGVCVVSGLSSVPALSSAAVRALTGDSIPQVIETAILPGNKSPRGLSVMASILTQVGRPMKVWRGGRWTKTTGWSDPKRYALPDGVTRQGWQIEVPDQRLFPAHFNAETVIFRAGLELGVMRYGLWAFACLRRWLPIPINGPVLRSFKRAADMLSSFGTDRGGMSVAVTQNGRTHWWHLLAEAGEGPFIPAVAARALLRRPSLPVGAGPALEVITLDEAEAAMSDLSVKTERGTATTTPIFKKVLGADFKNLPETIRVTHETADISHWRGHASVSRGTGVWSDFLGWLFGFPPASDAIEVEVTKTRTAKGESWLRQFGNRHFRSHLAATPDGMTERFGPFTFLLGLYVKDHALHYPVRSGRCGPIPLPRIFMPISQAREYEKNGRFHFDVKLFAPLTGRLLVHYQGDLSAVHAAPEAANKRVNVR